MIIAQQKRAGHVVLWHLKRRNTLITLHLLIFITYPLYHVYIISYPCISVMRNSVRQDAFYF